MTRKHALVSLPGSLVGKVVRSEVLDVPLTDQATVADDDDDDGDGDDGADTAAAPPSPKSWLHVGQLVRCVVLSTHKGTGSGAGATGGKQIELSVRPSNVNKGRVTCAVFSHACPLRVRGGGSVTSAHAAAPSCAHWTAGEPKMKRSTTTSLPPSRLLGEHVVEGLTLSAAVASVEDHGYVMAIGVPVSPSCPRHVLRRRLSSSPP